MVVNKGGQRDVLSYESLNHSRCNFKYHNILIPNERKKCLYGKIQKFPGHVLHNLARKCGSEIVEGHMVVYVHLLMKIPPKWPKSHQFSRCYCTASHCRPAECFGKEITLWDFFWPGDIAGAGLSAEDGSGAS